MMGSAYPGWLLPNPAAGHRTRMDSVRVDMAALAFAVLLIRRTDDFEAGLAPVGGELVRVVDVDVQRAGHVRFGVVVVGEMNDEIAPVRERVRLWW